jgi:hypothetical protein
MQRLASVQHAMRGAWPAAHADQRGVVPERQVGLVIDLTKSWQYYSVEEWLGVAHHKVHFGACSETVSTRLAYFQAGSWHR